MHVKNEIQSLKQKCQNVQIKSYLQRKNKVLVTFFGFILHRGSSFFRHLFAVCEYEHIHVLAFQFSEAGFHINKDQSNDGNYDLGI